MDLVEKFNIFKLVAEKSSFSEVARLLGVPRSTITYAIKALEKDYEVLLFYRTTRHVQLTHEGEIFYQEAQRLLDSLVELNRFKHTARRFAGKISIGLPQRLASQILIPHLHEFKARYPQIKIAISSRDIFSNLLHEQLDCVIRVGQPKDDYLIIQPLAHTRLLTLTAPAYIQQYGKPENLDDLSMHRAIEYGAEKIQKGFTSLVFRQQQANIDYGYSVEDTESYLQCGLHGLGIIQIPEFDAKPFLAAGQLCEILEQYEPLSLPIQLLLTDKQYRPQYLQDFLSWVKEVFKSAM